MPSKSHTDLSESEYTITAVRASGPGGQHVNKVSTAVVLRFDISASSLPETVKQRLLASGDNRITEEGIVLIKSGNFRSQLRNKEAAVERLQELIAEASKVRKQRKPTKPTKAAVEKRLDEKAQRGELKTLRKKPRL